MILDAFLSQLPDTDPQETQEWLDSLDAVVAIQGTSRAKYLIQRVLEHARLLQVNIPATISTPYVNTIPSENEPWFPGNAEIEERLRAYIRWNAAVMVIRTNRWAEGLGGHLSTYASSAALYEVGFHHFFQGKDSGRPGDMLYIQGHAAPGIYARAFLEGYFTQEQLDNFRQEVNGNGLSSYPHPRLMPDFWEFPTVSMGIGPINAIYQARFLRYLHARRIDDTTGTRVWAFLGDGEMDEPESLGALALAGREQLDNLTFVVNCNLQRLDGPVRGNSKVIQELESLYRGAGWNVIKVIWGKEWDPLLASDVDGVLLNKMNTTVDGEFQRFTVENGAYIRDHFFGPDQRLRKLVEHLGDDDLRCLPRGGHDYSKLYAAYKAAVEHKGAPTVILAKTVKGWALGSALEGRNSTHQIKKMTKQQIREFRDRLHLQEEIPDSLLDVDDPPYYRPPADSDAFQYLMQRRKELSGPLPRRIVRDRRPLTLPSEKAFAEFSGGSGKQEVSSTIVMVRLLRNLMRDEKFGSRVVPIVPDECRTFGMDSFFSEFGIYASHGQKYDPVDADLLLSYTEKKDGQLLEEGITEAGAMADCTAAGTSYATRGVPMVPFFMLYSMFGFQRIGDMIWAFADARGKGFVLGATAGRTTLTGEGLQHCDGHSPVLASTVPSCQVYDPAFAYELAAIVQHGINRMYGPNPEDIFYYLTLYNENYPMPAMPEELDKAEILRGMYRYEAEREGCTQHAAVLFSGPSHAAAIRARDLLAEHYGVGVELWSVTSYKALREEAMGVERWNRLHPEESPRVPLVTQLLLPMEGPKIAVTDYMKIVVDQVGRWVPGTFVPLGTDGFGRSDTRANLRRFFEVDAEHIAVSVLWALASQGDIERTVVSDAITRFGVDPQARAPFAL